jgi:hypothetical protein
LPLMSPIVTRRPERAPLVVRCVERRILVPFRVIMTVRKRGPRERDRAAARDLSGGGPYVRSVVMALVAFFAHGVAQAEKPPHVVIAWSAPAGCPGAADVSASVDKLLGEQAPRPQAPLRVSATITKAARGAFRARLEIEAKEARRVREFQGISCAAVADATALIIALTIDPSAVVMETPAAPPPAAPKPATPSEPPLPALPFAEPADLDPQEPMSSPIPHRADPGDANVSPAESGAGTTSVGDSTGVKAPASARAAAPPFSAAPTASSVTAPRRKEVEPVPSPSSVALAFGAWGGADVGSLPAVAAGVGASISLFYRGQRFDLGASLWPERAERAADYPSSGGDFGIVAGSAGTCRDLLAVGPILAGPCFAAEIGWMSAAGFGVNEPKETGALWAALKPGAMVAVRPTRRAAVVVHLDAAVPLSRPTFVITGAGGVHRPGSVAGRASAGLEFLF